MALPSTHVRVSQTTATETVFAATPLNLRNKSDQEYLTDSLVSSRSVSSRAWRHWERLGVIRYPLNRAARLAGATRLYAGMVSEDGTSVSRITPDDKTISPAIDVVKAMYSRVSGVRGLIERYFIQQKVAADSHLVRVKEGKEYDGYQFLSPDELRTGADGVPGTASAESDGIGDLTWTLRPGGIGQAQRTRKIAKKDYLGRVWQPSARYLDMTDPVLYTLDADCDLLFRMQVVMRAQMRSRAALSGAIFLPSSLQNMAAGKVLASGPQDLVAKFNQVISQNLELAEDGDAADIAHIILSGKDEAGALIREIVFGQETKETDLKLRQELFDRILFSLDISAKASTETTNTRFESWNSTSEELRLAVIPDMEALCWALTRLVLHPQLLDANMKPESVAKTVVWYDLSEASVKINRQDDAIRIGDRGGLKLSAQRRVGGFTETDAPDEVEYVRSLGYLAKNPYLATFEMDVADRIDWEKAMVKPTGRPTESPGDPPAPGPGQGDPGSPDSTDTPDKPEKV